MTNAGEMSYDYNDQIVRLVHNKFSDNIMECLRDVSVIDVPYGMESVRVPLVAGASVVYKKGLGQFVIQAKIIQEKEVLGGNLVFSEKEILTSKTAANMVDHVVENLRRMLHRAIAEKDFQRVIAECSK